MLVRFRRLPVLARGLALLSAPLHRSSSGVFAVLEKSRPFLFGQAVKRNEVGEGRAAQG
jgi:hypothetical protein